MLVFAAFTPHPLISIPEIGKKHVANVRHTLKSYKHLAYELYASQPDSIIVFSPHASTTPGTFSVSQRPAVAIDFTQFGDLSDTRSFQVDVGFGYQIKESVEDIMPVMLSDDAILDYGTAVPLYHLTRSFDTVALGIIPIGYSSLDLAAHRAFGKAINRKINATTKRVAVIASGDLSHGSSKNAVTPYNPKAFSFNKMIRNALNSGDYSSLFDLAPDQLEGITECGMRSLILLLGVLDERTFKTEVLSYESALGVGYLTAQFHVM